jgi:hypothetical protein
LIIFFNTRRAVALFVVSAAMTSPAFALLEFNEGRDKIAVTAGYGISYDSNLFAHAGGAGDYNQSLSLDINYTRRAGLIGVSGSIGVSTGRFDKYTGEDFTNPTCQLEFSKDKGRLTGAISLSAQRQSSSDVTINERTDSWNYGGAVKFRYPINDRYFFSSQSEFSLADYLNNTSLFNLSSYSEAVDVYYTYTSKLDLMGGYRLRLGGAQGGSSTRDQDLTFGATGGILPKLNGSVRFGYQWRNETGTQGGQYDSLTSSVSLAWPVTKRLNFSASASKDFATTATDVSVDSTDISLSAAVKPIGKINVNPRLDYTVSRFLGPKGGGREDRALSCSLSISLALTSHISASISYAYIVNQSNVAFSDFGRHTASVNLSARY